MLKIDCSFAAQVELSIALIWDDTHASICLTAILGYSCSVLKKTMYLKEITLILQKGYFWQKALSQVAFLSKWVIVIIIHV